MRPCRRGVAGVQHQPAARSQFRAAAKTTWRPAHHVPPTMGTWCPRLKRIGWSDGVKSDAPGLLRIEHVRHRRRQQRPRFPLRRTACHRFEIVGDKIAAAKGLIAVFEKVFHAEPRKTRRVAKHERKIDAMRLNGRRGPRRRDELDLDILRAVRSVADGQRRLQHVFTQPRAAVAKPMFDDRVQRPVCRALAGGASIGREHFCGRHRPSIAGHGSERSARAQSSGCRRRSLLRLPPAVPSVRRLPDRHRQ